MSNSGVKSNLMCMTLTNSNVSKAVKSYTMSKRYMNTMLKASVLSILYHRLNLDETEFITKHFHNIAYKSFKPKSTNMHIREFHAYMTACKDAIEKNYLRQMFLFIIDVDTGDIIESYQFSFKYSTSTEPLDQQNAEALVEVTKELLTTLKQLGENEKITCNFEIRVELTYFNRTPDDYEPPGFQPIDKSSSMIKCVKHRNSVILGTLKTGFHEMKCRGKGKLFDFNISDDDVIIINEEEEEEEENNKQDVTGNYTEDLTEVMSNDFLNKSNNKSNLNETYMSNLLDVGSVTEEKGLIDCICKLPETELPVDVVKCTICNRKYHTPCVGYLDKSYIRNPLEYNCNHCKINNNGSSMDDVERKMEMPFGRVRFLIACLHKYKKIPSGLEEIFQGVIAQLQCEKILNSSGSDVAEIAPGTLDSLFKSDYKSKKIV